MDEADIWAVTRRAAAEYADMDRSTLYRWMADDTPMRKAVIKAEAESEVRFATVVTSWNGKE
jgi:hypothetical protein